MSRTMKRQSFYTRKKRIDMIRGINIHYERTMDKFYASQQRNITIVGIKVKPHSGNCHVQEP
jgi:hypothetical protein